MIAVVIPACNEAETIGACLRSVCNACEWRGFRGEPVAVVVVLDACTDATSLIARRFGVTTLACTARTVGHARALGANWAIDHGARWLAFTDADTTVAPDWIAMQLALEADAVCGTIAVQDWGHYGARMERHFRATYTDADDHRHIYGANLGVSANAYRKAGGFRALETSEDVALVAAVLAHGASVAWSSAPRVVTSARQVYRAPGGFGATLARIDAQAAWVDAAALNA